MGQHQSRDFWAQLVAEYEQVAATQTLRTFARRRGVSAKSLSNWRSKFRRQARTEQTLVPVVVRPVTREPVVRDRSTALIVRLGVEPTIEVVDIEQVSATWIGELITSLAKVPR